MPAAIRGALCGSVSLEMAGVSVLIGLVSAGRGKHWGY